MTCLVSLDGTHFVLVAAMGVADCSRDAAGDSHGDGPSQRIDRTATGDGHPGTDPIVALSSANKLKRLYAGAGYGNDAKRSLLKSPGIRPFIRGRKSPHGSHSGRVGDVLEPTINWREGLRRCGFESDCDHDNQPFEMVDSMKNIALIFVYVRVLKCISEAN